MKRYIITFLLVTFVGYLIAEAAPKPKHVVFIGLDGWAANTYDQSEMPFVKKLAAEGAFTKEKRSVLPSSSAVNWASIFMGAGPEVHGYLNWGSKTPELTQPTDAVKTNGIFPTVFQLARLQHPKADIALFAEWDGIKHLVDTLSFSHFEQTAPEATAARAGEYLKAVRPELIAIVFDRPDHPGHDNGWGSPEYYAMMTRLDNSIAEIFKALEEAGMIDDTMVIITADHGGKGTGHGGTSMSEMQSPLIIWGKGVRPATTITDMVVSYDIAPTIARALGLKTPSCWRGRAVTQALR